MKLKLNFDIVFSNTITSYEPDVAGKSSGKTGSDIERILAFKSLQIEDPGLYHSKWNELVDYAIKCEEINNG